MSTSEERSPKHEGARKRIPDDLAATYDQLVEEYRFRTETRYGRGYVAYEVLADLVLLGWRPSGPDTLDDPTETRQT